MQIALYMAGGVMSTTSLRNLALVLIALTVTFTSAFAHEEKHEHRQGRDRAEHHEHFEKRSDHRNWERSRTREHWQHQRTRWQAEHRGNEHRPSGWDHGQKQGWRGNSVPPGQAKKDGGKLPFHPAGNHVNSNNTPQNTKSNKSPHDTNMAKVFPVSHKR
jgi:Ni/Co efflux regulator RcnB